MNKFSIETQKIRTSNGPTTISRTYDVQEKNGNPYAISKEEFEDLVDQASSVLFSQPYASVYVLEGNESRPLSEAEKSLLREVIAQKLQDKRDREIHPRSNFSLFGSILLPTSTTIRVGIPTKDLNGHRVPDTPGKLKVDENMAGAQLDFKVSPWDLEFPRL